jgi:hypothetical protein
MTYKNSLKLVKFALLLNVENNRSLVLVMGREERIFNNPLTAIAMQFLMGAIE